MRVLIALLAVLALAADKPKIQISKASPVEEKKEAKSESVKPMSVAARCSSCDEAISGTLTVTATRVAFCCKSWEKRDENAKATAVCPWSFDVALDDVDAQYLETGDGVWHLVTKAGVDYAFASDEDQAMQRAFESVRTAQPELPAKRLMEKFAAKVQDAKAPKLVERDCRE